MATIKQIRDFLVLSEELHFARSAERLGISQAALSLEIQKLEESVGCTLFDRSDRWRIRLTEAGAAYRDRVRVIPDVMETAQEAARRASRGESGRLSIIVANTVYESVDIGAMLQRMAKCYPDVKIKIMDRLSSPQAADILRSGECDVGICALIHNTSPLDGLRYFSIADADMVLAFPANHPLARKPDLRIEDLRHCGFIFPPREEAPVLRQLFEEYFLLRCHSLPVIEHEAVGFSAIRQLVTAGLGIGLIPSGRPDRNIVFRELNDRIKRSVVVAWDPDNRSATLCNFLRLFQREDAE